MFSKQFNLIFLFLVIIIIFSLLLPDGLRAAIANNLWSVRFIKAAYAQGEVDPREISPPEAHQHAGMLLAHQALKSEDVEGAWQSIENPGKSPDALMLNTYAQVRYLRGDTPEALDAWKAAGNARSLHNAAVELRKADQFELASLAGRLAYEIYPEEYAHGYAFRLFENGQTDQAIAILNQMLEDYPGSLRRSLWYRFLADFHQKTEDYSGAADVYNRALAEDPNNAGLWLSLGALYAHHLDDLPQAIFCVQNAIAADPEQSTPYYDIAALYLQNGQTEQAVQAIEKAISLEPESIKVYLRTAQIYEASGDLQKAREAFQSVLAVNPDHPEALQGVKRLLGSN